MELSKLLPLAFILVLQAQITWAEPDSDSKRNEVVLQRLGAQEQIYIPPCDKKGLGMSTNESFRYCLDSKNEIESLDSVTETNTNGESIELLKLRPLARQDLFNFAIKTVEESTLKALPKCDDPTANLKSGAACAIKAPPRFVDPKKQESFKIGNQTYTLGTFSRTYKDENGQTVFDSHPMRKKELYDWIQSKYVLTTKRLDVENPGEIDIHETPPEINKLAGADACVTSAYQFLHGSKDANGNPILPEDAKRFLQLQMELTYNRLYYAFLNGASVRGKGSDFDKDQFGVRSAIVELLRTKGTKEYLAAATAFENSKITNLAVSKVLPALSEILGAQSEFAKNNPELAIGDSDIKLMAMSAESDATAQPFNFAMKINESLKHKKLSKKEIEKEKADLAKTQKQLVSESQKLVDLATDPSKRTECKNTEICQFAKNQTSRAAYQGIQAELYKKVYQSAHLRPDDLPKNLLETHSDAGQYRGASGNAGGTGKRNSSKTASFLTYHGAPDVDKFWVALMAKSHLDFGNHCSVDIQGNPSDAGSTSYNLSLHDPNDTKALKSLQFNQNGPANDPSGPALAKFYSQCVGSKAVAKYKDTYQAPTTKVAHASQANPSRDVASKRTIAPPPSLADAWKKVLNPNLAKRVQAFGENCTVTIIESLPESHGNHSYRVKIDDSINQVHDTYSTTDSGNQSADSPLGKFYKGCYPSAEDKKERVADYASKVGDVIHHALEDQEPTDLRHELPGTRCYLNLKVKSNGNTAIQICKINTSSTSLHCNLVSGREFKKGEVPIGTEDWSHVVAEKFFTSSYDKCR